MKVGKIAICEQERTQPPRKLQPKSYSSRRHITTSRLPLRAAQIRGV